MRKVLERSKIATKKIFENYIILLMLLFYHFIVIKLEWDKYSLEKVLRILINENNRYFTIQLVITILENLVVSTIIFSGIFGVLSKVYSNREKSNIHKFIEGIKKYWLKVLFAILVTTIISQVLNLILITSIINFIKYNIVNVAIIVLSWLYKNLIFTVGTLIIIRTSIKRKNFFNELIKFIKTNKFKEITVFIIFISLFIIPIYFLLSNYRNELLLSELREKGVIDYINLFSYSNSTKWIDQIVAIGKSFIESLLFLYIALVYQERIDK
ncbi:hypothetical protein [Sporosalibacterium faouarense]|uniref:hypothetical protein n=1 Tax=Sporosalibacterium faouarense TaxID=516123 RepID=UPI00192BDB66|nr:hypothetical protein [Sporosalibacterium faouarense]